MTRRWPYLRRSLHVCEKTSPRIAVAVLGVMRQLNQAGGRVMDSEILQLYATILSRIETLMDAGPDTPEGEELQMLVTLAEFYERKEIPR
jgi:hypothetical protein